jgi:hypothetical protein
MDFLKEVSEEEVLAKIRAEVVATRTAGNVASRCQSATLQQIMERYFPGRSGNTQELLAVVRELQPTFAALPIEDWHVFLPQLASVIVAVNPNIGTQCQIFACATAMFKRYWVPLGESENGRPPDKSPHVFLAKKYLHVEFGEIMMHREERRKKDRARLCDKFKDDYQRVRSVCLEMSRAECQTRHESMQWLLAVMLACGCRKGEVLDLSIRFERLSPQDFGIFGDLRSQHVRIKEDAAFEQLIGSANCIVQVGVEKDGAQRVNKYIEPTDPRYVPARRIVKPLLFLNADELIALVQKFRAFNRAALEGPWNRCKDSLKFRTTRMTKIFEKYFEVHAKKSRDNGWSYGTHFCRALYGNASFEQYAKKVEQITGKSIDRTVWLGIVLGHAGSLQTAVLYQKVDVKMTEEDTLNLTRHQSGIMNEERKMVAVDRHRKRHFHSEEDLLECVHQKAEELRSKHCNPTFANLTRLGFGKNTVQLYKKKLKT